SLRHWPAITCCLLGSLMRRRRRDRCPGQRLPGQWRRGAGGRGDSAARPGVCRAAGLGRVGDAHRLRRLGRAAPVAAPVPRGRGALRRAVSGADLLPSVLTTRKGPTAMKTEPRFPRFTLSILTLAALPLPALAQGLPTMEDPSRGQGSGIMQTLQNYGYDIVLLVALLVVASMFVGV